MKSASVNVRINENIKQHAESILEDLGLSRAVAIDLFYRQIILHNGLPFDLKLNTPPLSTSDFSPSELEDILYLVESKNQITVMDVLLKNFSLLY